NNYTFHIEATNEPRKVIDHVRGLNCDVGIALNPDTPFRDIEPMISEVDVVLVMSVWPGFGGQRFIAEVLPKAAEISRNLRPDQRLEFDGGIDFQTVGSAAENGADTFVAGFAIFGASDPVAAMARIREAAQASKAAGGER
ncbi:MAG: ribulose-phosphate 3-epimerase, partial [Planctomycetota bacterium]|nr:ribulose-phosphate 3-epimerase [Planctomycetota bacterium]